MLASAGVAQAVHEDPSTEGHTTLEQIITPTDQNAADAGEYTTLGVEEVAGSYLVRDPAGVAQAGRDSRRDSLSYVSQFTDFQVADEESPARVEFLDPQAGSAWRPQEAFTPFVVDAMIRQVNRFADASPVPQGDGNGAEMDFGLITGDQADNQQHNETVWIRELLEGNGPIDFGTGSEDTDFITSPQTLARNGCLGLLGQFGGDADAVAAEAAGYTGVQDYDDYPGEGNTAFYDPDDVQGDYATLGWPTFDGLMDHVQGHGFTPEGLEVPFYITNGNHDALVQGNEDSIRLFEDIALSCNKILATNADPSTSALEALFTNPAAQMLVPADDERRHVSKTQIKDIYGASDPGDDDHGFALVDPAELAASNDSASYYAWEPPESPGFKFIAIDTVSEGGVLGPFGPQPTGSSEGNIDDPQWQWLEAQLEDAVANEQRVMLFGHHPIRTLTVFHPADEEASPCTVNEPPPLSHDHDINPGCDLDPRDSTPLHLGEPDQRPVGDATETLTELLDRFPNVLGYISGHTHENDIRSYERADGTVWWEIGTSAGADWPQQARLIEVMDNDDGTLSIFTTILDPALPATSPEECVTDDCAAAFGTDELASLGHTFAFNDPQNTGAPRVVAEGDPEDQNTELLLDDPFPGGGGGPGPGPGPGDDPLGSCDTPALGTPAGETIIGTPLPDGVRARAGSDRVRGLAGDDCLFGNQGADRVRGGPGEDLVVGNPGRDNLGGGAGDDVIRGGRHRDRAFGGAGDDVINVPRGGRDVVNCGAGDDLVRAGRNDVIRRNCERVRFRT